MRYLTLNIFIVLCVLVILAGIFIWAPAFYFLILVAPPALLGLYDITHERHTILRNFPLLRHFRYIFEFIAPEIQQYVIERHTDGKPLSRNHRQIVYKRAKGGESTHPFGTELDLYKSNYEGLKHSIYPKEVLDKPPRVRIGGADCKQPYDA